MKTFLEVEGKMGSIPVPVLSNQFRPPLPDTNSNVRKNDVTEKRKRATPKKKFRPSTSKPTTVCPPLPEAPLKPKNSMLLSSVPVREDTPWPSTGKMLGNLFEDRNWLLPKNYLATENKNENATGITSPKPSLKEEPTIGEQSIISPKQRNADGDQIALLAKIRTRKIGIPNIKISYSRKHCTSHKCKGPSKMTPKLTEA